MDTYATLNDALVKLFRDVMDLEEQVIITEEFQDITNNDMHVIQAIGTGEPKNMSTIAKELSVTVGTLTIAMNSLVKKGYYDGLIFHRVIEGFMIQGGCPDGTGMGGPGYSIKGEFNQNRFKNDLKHSAGVLSMARTMMPNSAGSQFFIMHKDAPHLDGAYAAFGKVTEGMDVVDKIAETKVQMLNTDRLSISEKARECIREHGYEISCEAEKLENIYNS